MPTVQRRGPQNSTDAVDARASLVEVARVRWVEQLIDTSRRNNLLFFRPTLGGSIEVAEGNRDVSRLLLRRTVSATSLLSDPSDRPSRILNIVRKARENAEEKGLETLFLAVGFAAWKAEDGGRDYRAPVFLFPLEFKRRGSEYVSVEITVAADPQINPVLVHVLQQQYGVRLNTEELLPQCMEDYSAATGNAPENPEAGLSRYREKIAALQSQAATVPEFRVDHATAISNFAFAKMAMVNDLKEASTAMNGNQLIAAIAGDDQARAEMISGQLDIDPRSIDEHRPDEEFCVVEADASQQSAIDGILAGQSAVVHGPPGTGKSQTITNLIATLAARGKTVLFVAEKRAALEVVQRRLQRWQLGHLAIDLHGAELSPNRVTERIAETLNTVRHATMPDCEALHRQFSERRLRLNGHDRRMHTASTRTGLSLFDMQGKLLALPPASKSEVRWRSAELERLPAGRRNEIRDSLAELAGLAGLVMGTDPSPWTGLSFNDGESTQRAISNARKLAFESLPGIRAILLELKSALGFKEPQDFAALSALTDFLSSIEAQLDFYAPTVYSADLTPTLAELARGDSAIKAFWLSISSPKYKQAFRDAIRFRNDVKASKRRVLSEIRAIIAASDRWRNLTFGKSSPTRFPGLRQLEEQTQEALQLVISLQNLVGAVWDGMSFDALSAAIEPFARDETTPYRLLRLTELVRKLTDLGLERLLTNLRTRQPDPACWPECFDYAWICSAIDELAVQDPEVKGFIGRTHDRYVNEFKQLDADRLKMAVERVRRAHAARAIQAMNDHPQQEALIKAEAAKTRRHKPLRSLFRDAWDVLTAICPCWMASPLSVSQLIDREARFDYVIFDEASQVLPEDAMASIIRGQHTVVAGDNQQLPPTGFFAAGLDDDRDDLESDGFESLLDMMLPFAKSFHLNWHYRSRDESLIAFSNHHIYKDRLVTFPGTGGPPCVSHILVNHIPDADGQEESCAEEVRRVIQLIIEHATNTADRSLGVIAMGIKHAMRLQGALDIELPKYPELADFFDPDHTERFFIKNLERVQGDERDSIIISVGYGKNRAGDLPLRFGPILSAGGRRRLNVAITRARETMTVVSSFSHLDIDPTRTREGTGLEFLRNFLQYASSGGTLIGLNEVTGESMNEFETDVCTVLEAHGMKLVPQVGCSKFRIDFGVCHPEQPGRFVMAIECDGASYHSSATARDRDRLRQQMLENLGWTFHRIWSTDWFFRKEEEVERAWNAYQAALERPIQTHAARKPELAQAVYQGSNRAPTPPRARRHPAAPPISAKNNISEYSRVELRRLYEWVMSDGVLRTHDEIADEMFKALPFSRRGARIESALRQTIMESEVRTPLQ